jgi:tRNA-dihydrouridine synthase C
MQLALAPMEGLVDALLRELITEAGGVDWCVTEFIRVNDRLLPERVFHRLAPELVRAALTPSGTPVRVQLLGSDPACLADNAALACTLGAPAIDLNFGCPAKTVNRSRGGAILLREPELLHAILRAVRAAVPPEIPVTAKMRLGVEAPDIALECAHALVDGGAETLVVHARTKLQGYKPPAHWEWVARIAEAVPVPVYANGEIWTVEDWQRCRAVSGVEDFMLGRGLVARPDLARQIAAVAGGQSPNPWVWQDVVPLLARFWARTRGLTPSGYAHGRLKQWLLWLSRSYPEAGGLFTQLRRETDVAQIDRALAEALNPVAFAA